MWFYEDHVSDKLRSKEIWERSTFVFLNSLNTPRKHILNNTQLHLQYDPSSLRSGKPLPRGNVSFLVFCTSSSFHVMTLLFCSCPVSLLLCLLVWASSHSTGHVLGSGQLTDSGALRFPVCNCSRLQLYIQSYPIAFLCLYWDGKAGNFQASPLWFYKMWVVAIAYKIYCCRGGQAL